MDFLSFYNWDTLICFKNLSLFTLLYIRRSPEPTFRIVFFPELVMSTLTLAQLWRPVGKLKCRTRGFWAQWALWTPNLSIWIIIPEVYGFVDQPNIGWACLPLKFWLTVSSLCGSQPLNSSWESDDCSPQSKPELTILIFWVTPWHTVLRRALKKAPNLKITPPPFGPVTEILY